MIMCTACRHETVAHAQIDGHCEMCPTCTAEREQQAKASK